jgi:hypothetical protein
MWPWEHLAVGYLAYSLLARARTGDSPDGPAALTVAVATQLPDLIDKPLAWTVGVYPGGYSVGHSIFVAGGLSALAVAISRRRGRPELGVAFVVGYLTHLPGDLLYIYVTRGYLVPVIGLWPVVPAVPGTAGGGLFDHFFAFLDGYVALLASGRLLWFAVAEAVLLVVALGVWLYDGRPGVGYLRRRIARAG